MEANFNKKAWMIIIDGKVLPIEHTDGKLYKLNTEENNTVYVCSTEGEKSICSYGIFVMGILATAILSI